MWLGELWKIPLTQQTILRSYVLTSPPLFPALPSLFRFVRGSYSTCTKFTWCSLTLGPFYLKGRRSYSCYLFYFTQAHTRWNQTTLSPAMTRPGSTGCHTQIWASFPDNRHSEGWSAFRGLCIICLHYSWQQLSVDMANIIKCILINAALSLSPSEMLFTCFCNGWFI